jgi:2-amino-4-hydroxy-6-hydroxymethyldihydropteridine diphosphokinase
MNPAELVYIALGTNIGDREVNLQTAKAALLPEVIIQRESSVYVTQPWGYADQPDFLNQVIEVSTQIEPLPLLRLLKRIEKQMGRVKFIQNGPRLIDLDLLFYGNRIVESPGLQIPHPRMQGRAFVLVPLNEIAPDFIHPILNISVREMLQDIDTSGVLPL